MALNVTDFGADPTGTHDSLQAFLDAIAAAGDSSRSAVSAATGLQIAMVGEQVIVPPGAYLLKGSLRLTRPVRMVGDFTSGRQTNTVLMFDLGGIELLHNNDTGGAQGTVLENLYIISKQYTSNRDERATNPSDGIMSQVVCRIFNCTVVGFGGNGIRLDGSDADSLHHNCCHSHIAYCWLEDNWLNGIYTHGGSSNGCSFVGCNFISNRLSGFKESSFLGNGHFGHAAENNGRYSYEHDGTSNWSSFHGCYAEQDNHARGGQGSVWIGGCLVVDRAPELGPPLYIHDAINHDGFNSVNRHHDDWTGMEASLCLAPNRVVEWQSRRLDDYEFQILRGDDGWYHITSGGTSGRSMLAFQADNKRNEPPDVWAKRGMRMGVGGARLTSASSVPSEPGRQGDVCLNTNLISGGFVGWAYDGATWRQFGAIS